MQMKLLLQNKSAAHANEGGRRLNAALQSWILPVNQVTAAAAERPDALERSWGQIPPPPPDKGGQGHLLGAERTWTLPRA